MKLGRIARLVRGARPVPLWPVAVLFVLPGCAEPDGATIALGARIYAAHCASCHGARLEGQPDWQQKRPNGRWPAPPLDDTAHAWDHTDRWLFHVVEKGMVPPPHVRHGHESDMPGFAGKLSNAEIRAVLAYIKSHWSEDTHRKREELRSGRQARARAPWHYHK